MTQEELFKKLVAHCKEYGFVFPSSEIYDGLGAVYDYGQNGVELKNNIKRYWWDSMVKLHENIVGIDAAIFMHPKTWEASGHVSAFNDPLIDNKDSKKRYRADVLIEDWLAKQDEKIEKEVEKARKRFGESFDEAKYRETSPRVAETAAKRDEVHKRFADALNANDLAELRQIIVDCEIACPISGTRNWTEVRQFNLMFSTQMGSTAEGANTIYLRPETAQGIFVNFLNVAWPGTVRWASATMTTASTTTINWPTTPTPRRTSNTTSRSGSRRSRASTRARTSTWAATRSFRARSCSTSIRRRVKAMYPMWSRRRSAWTACSCR